VTTHFERLLEQFAWVPIPGCPGRYTLKGAASVGFEVLLGAGIVAHRERSLHARDVVVWAEFADGGGLISYDRGDGGYRHTLNTPEGLARKLRQLGLRG
jgi:hypothetical protein